MNHKADSAEQASEEQARLQSLGARLAEVVHDLRNPLGSILAIAEILERAAKSDDRQLVESLKENTLQCRAIVDDLLFFSSGRSAPIEEFQPVRVLGATLKSRRDRREGITIRAIATGPDFAFRGRPEDIKRLVLNLVRNAEEAMAEAEQNGCVTVRFGPSPQYDQLNISVEDEGPGFPPNFDLDNPGPNAGLGLRICRRVVGDHDGKWRWEERLAGGSKISTSLKSFSEAETKKDLENRGSQNDPVDDAPSGYDPPREQERTGGFQDDPIDQKTRGFQQDPIDVDSSSAQKEYNRSLRILVVDDDRNTCETYERILALEGHAVETCERGRDGFEQFRSGGFDLAIVDVKLPDLDGPSFFRELETQDPQKTKGMIFATGDVSNEDTMQFLKDSGNAFLIKPFEIAELRQAIQLTLNNQGDHSS